MSFFLLRGKRAGSAHRWPVVAGALGAGLVGLILAIATSDSGIQALGDQVVDGKIMRTYELNVRLFRTMNQHNCIQVF